MGENCDFFKKFKLDLEKDVLVVIYFIVFIFFNEFGGWKMEEDVEEEDLLRNQGELDGGI